MDDYVHKPKKIKLFNEDEQSKLEALFVRHGVFIWDNEGKTPLCSAVEQKNPEIVDLLIRQGADINGISADGITPLVRAIMNNDNHMAMDLINRGAKINLEPVENAQSTSNISRKSLKRSPLYHAVVRGNTTIAEELLKRGAVCEFEMNLGTVLHYAIKKKNQDMVTLLLKHGANPNSVKILNLCPLNQAILLSDKNIVNLLLDHGANVNFCPSYQNHDSTYEAYMLTPLQLAVLTDEYEIAALLVKRGANVNCKDHGTKIVLYDAVNRSTEMVKLLLDHGAEVSSSILSRAIKNQNISTLETLLEKNPDVNKRDPGNKFPLHIAIDSKNDEIALLLLSHGADVRLKGDYGLTALHKAVEHDNKAMVLECLNRGADINAKFDNENERCSCEFPRLPWKFHEIELKPFNKSRCAHQNGMTPLHLAISKDNVNMAELLLTYGADINATDIHGMMPMHYAVLQSAAMVETLVRAGGDVNCERKHGYRPIHISVASKNPFMVELLLKRGAEVKDYASAFALQHAVMLDKKAIVRLLLSRGANVHQIYPDGKFIMHLAVLCKSTEMVAILADQGADLDVDGCNYYRTPLMYAIQEARIDMVRELLERGANINCKCRDGMTPLIYTMFLCYIYPDIYIKIEKLLITYGAKVNEWDKKGKTALSYAIQSESIVAVEMLLNAGADLGKEQSLIMESQKDMRDWLLFRVIKLQTLGWKFSKGVNDVVEGVKEQRLLQRLEKFRKGCKEEVEKMKEKMVSEEFKVSVYEAMTSNNKKIASYLRGGEMQEILKSDEFEKQFPRYSSMIGYTVKKSVENYQFINERHNMICEILDEVHEVRLPPPCTWRISSFFSRKDVQILKKKYK